VNKKRKIIFFDFVTHYGGAQRSTVFVLKQLKNFDEIYVIDAYGFCERYINALAAHKIPTHILLPGARTVYIGHSGKILKRALSLLKQLPILIKLRSRLIKKIREINPDVIWTNSYKALLFLLPNFRLRRYPVFFYARGWSRRCEVGVLARWLIKKADYVLAISNATAKELESWGVQKEKIKVIHTPIDFNTAVEGSNKDAQLEPPGTKSSFKVLLPGQLLLTKGQHTAIEAAHLLKQEGLDLVVWLVGDIKIGTEDNYYKYIKDLISRYGLQDSVFLLGWRNDVLSLMNLCDVVILPSHTEGFPRTVWEAMVLKRPVIATPVGGVVDIIKDGKTGLLMPVDNAEALAQNLKKLILDKKLCAKLTQNAYNQLVENFSVDKQVKLLRESFSHATRVKSGNNRETQTA